MGIDRSLTDDFPSLVINGETYHYGRETAYGQYLVENASEAKDYWCFDTKRDLLAFLVNLPESADRDWIKTRYPDWHEVTHERRLEYMRERDAHFRKRMEAKEADGTARYFNVVCFDEAGWYCAYADTEHVGTCDDVDVRVRVENLSGGRKEHLIELNTRKTFGRPEKGTFKLWRGQALKLASALVDAALEVEARRPELESGGTA